MGRKDKSKIRKAEILEHFFEVFKKEGIEGASIAKIAKHMDIHPSLIIHYFKTKNEMVIELADYMFEKNVIPILENFKSITDIEKRFNLFLEILITGTNKRKQERFIMPSIIYLASRDEVIQKRLKTKQKFTQKFIEEEVSLYIEHGIIKEGNPKLIAKLIVITSIGITNSKFLDDSIADDEFKKYLLEKIKKILI